MHRKRVRRKERRTSGIGGMRIKITVPTSGEMQRSRRMLGEVFCAQMKKKMLLSLFWNLIFHLLNECRPCFRRNSLIIFLENTRRIGWLVIEFRIIWRRRIAWRTDWTVQISWIARTFPTFRIVVTSIFDNLSRQRKQFISSCQKRWNKKTQLSSCLIYCCFMES